MGPTPLGPVVQSVTPGTGSTAGGTEITIRGQRFAAGAAVAIGGQPAIDVTVPDAGTIVAKTPPGPAGAAAVVVTVAGRTGSLPGGFTYVTPPDNKLPVITAMTAQGTRWFREPPNFAELSEPITLTALVSDEETPPEQLDYRWSASVGTIDGSGARGSWRAPEAATTPLDVTITLRVVEKYGSGGIFQQQVSGTQHVSLHDSRREVGEMARRFLIEFSKPQENQDWGDIMRDFDFAGAACPDPNGPEAEKKDVVTHYTNFVMNHYTIGTPVVDVAFGVGCSFRNRLGDACAAVPVSWESKNIRTNQREQTSGTDYIAAAYSRAGARWWLCSSDYDAKLTLAPSFYSR